MIRVDTWRQYRCVFQSSPAKDNMEIASASIVAYATTIGMLGRGTVSGQRLPGDGKNEGAR